VIGFTVALHVLGTGLRWRLCELLTVIRDDLPAVVWFEGPDAIRGRLV
jgi:hypothetical protein